MSSFTENLIVSPLPDGKQWVTRREFYYDVGDKDSGDRICVPIGFVTDFASIPRFLWWLFPKWGKYGNASVIHDYLYSTRLRSRREADAIFYEGMIVLQTPRWQARLIYLAVRWFGWIAYRFRSPKPKLEVLPETMTIPIISLKVTAEYPRQ
jgi:hypothetical protein